MSRILVVDDEATVRNFLKEFLESNNFRTDTAETIAEALDLLKNHSYECIILDMILPEQNGIFLIEKMREMDYHQPVILITGQPDVDSAKQAVKFKAYDYLTKPIINSELLAVVKNAVKQNQIQIKENELKEQQELYRKELELQVQESFEREKQYELKLMHEHKLAAIGQLATGIAHNLNTPISVVLGNAELLLLKYGESPEINKIVRQAERMSSIIQSLLTKSSREQSKKPQVLDLNLLIASELEIFTANLNFKHNIEKKLHFDDNIPEIFGVYSDFSQSVMNIIQNAIDAMHYSEVKKLGVGTSFDGTNIYIEIEDTGCGISEDDKSKLFDPFYTTKPPPDQRVKDEPTGTGLGLSSVHSLLSEYGIKIDFKTKENSGTKVILTIPYNNVTPPEEK